MKRKEEKKRLALDKPSLQESYISTWHPRTHVAENSSPKLLTSLESLDRNPVLGDALALAVDALQGVNKTSGGYGRIRNRGLHLLFLGLEVEGSHGGPPLVATRLLLAAVAGTRLSLVPREK